MGPGGCDEPGRWPVVGPHVAIVSFAEFAEQGTMSADYFVNREPGESWTQFRVRRQAEVAEDRATSHEGHALHLRAEAAAMRLHAGLPGSPQQSSEYERGRAEALAQLAGMTTGERNYVLDEVAVMIEATRRYPPDPPDSPGHQRGPEGPGPS